MSEILTDASLLARYVQDGAESAFTEIVRRRLPLVFGTALRRLGGDRAGAEDVAQAVFLALSRQASELLQHPALAGWLYSTTVRQANDYLRRRQRRQTRELNLMNNANLNQPAEVDWRRLQPILDDAMQDLREDDRHAVVLRFFEQCPFSTIGSELGMSEDAARMRVSRSLDKLRASLAKRGLMSSAAALGAVLAAQLPTEVPAGLAQSIQCAVQAGPAGAMGASALSSSILKLSVAALVLLTTAGGIGWLSLHKRPPRSETFAARALALGAMSSNRPHARLPFGRTSSLSRAAANSPMQQGLKYLRSALFDIPLGRAKRFSLMEASAGLLVDYEEQTLPLFREALNSSETETIAMAIEAAGRFGLPLMRELGPDLLALLKKPNFKDPEQARLLANRLGAYLAMTDRSIGDLVELWLQRPEFQEPIVDLLRMSLRAGSTYLAQNREALSALLNDNHAEVRDAAEKILAEAPQLPPPMSPEVIQRITAKLRSSVPEECSQGLLDVWMLGRVEPEIRQAMVEAMQHDSKVQNRVSARQLLQRFAPEDPALTELGGSGVAERDVFLSRLERREVPAQEMLAALAERPAEIPAVCQQLGKVESSYWSTHPEEKMSAVLSLSSLFMSRDSRVFEAADAALVTLDTHRVRSSYRLDELQPFFDVMEANLKPGEYAIAMRDLKPGVEMYWKAHGFTQAEPTHLPAEDVKTLLVGPYHQNRPAYDAMLEVMQQIDPKFRSRTP